MGKEVIGEKISRGDGIEMQLGNRRPISTVYDYILLGFAIVLIILPLVAANIIILKHRRRIYFRSLGGVDLILATTVAGIIWITCNFVTNEHFERRFGILRNCSLWTFWLQLPFGSCLWLTLLFLRLLRLYFISVKGKIFSKLKTWLVQIPLLLFPAIFVSLLATLEEASKWKDSYCDIADNWKKPVYLTIPPLYIFSTLCFLICIWKQKDFLLKSEHRFTVESTTMVFVVYLLDAVIFISGKQIFIAGRCFLTFCVCSLVFLDFWARLGKPVYFCIFQSDVKMENFEEELRWCGAAFLDKLTNSESIYHHRNSIPISHFHDGNHLLQTMSIIMSDIAEYEERLKSLGLHKSRLIQRIQDEEKESSGFLHSFPVEAAFGTYTPN